MSRGREYIGQLHLSNRDEISCNGIIRLDRQSNGNANKGCSLHSYALVFSILWDSISGGKLTYESSDLKKTLIFKPYPVDKTNVTDNVEYDSA
ncbi:16897_t:CDS:2 [Cetraspora pellucida]|uniref:16897_t:CDS:1 n=1 Tax=Cetraspora pellucida TaxID=1433469 RepID=A0A9N9NMX0_9GLOM|nr:16897_t:CDS:2 [Cetraspora pellucida]